MFVEILPPNVRKKISAGEVIESPADVVKELVENSLDAKATEIEVEISKGGKRLIVVQDNGIGIHPEDIDKVFLEGATSKIREEKDLLRITSYGFRGEALHSIATVSRMTISSRYFQELEGWKVEVEEGKLLSKEKVGMPVGTRVEVRDLFFNVPVRRKHLKREDSERNRIANLLREYALANHKVAFRFFSNAKKILELPSTKSQEERASDVLGGRVETFYGEREFLRVKVFARRNVTKGKIHLFVNSRPVDSRNLKDFLRNLLGYKTLAAVFIELPPFLVDFNVHPKKREVRFLKERKTLTLLREALKEEKYPLEEEFLAQEVKPYSSGFEIIGQLEDTVIVAKSGDYLYFFDQHLLSESTLYKRLGREDLSCRGALKAGKTLTQKEMKELIEEWKRAGAPKVCPHGRPVYFRLHLKDIYEKLGRVY